MGHAEEAMKDGSAEAIRPVTSTPENSPFVVSTEDIDELSLTQRFAAVRPDPLGDVISWLDNVDLGEELGEDLSRVWQETGSGLCGEGLFGVRELLADTPSEGAAAALHNPRSRCGENKTPQGAGPPALSRHSRPLTPSRSGGSQQRQSSRGACCFTFGQEARNFALSDMDEEEEWDARQKQTGAAGRLVVYSEGDRPREDLNIRGGSGRRVIVTAVAEDGKAHKAGVKAGDILVSINGKKDFVQQSADEVHAGLTAPVMLVFMGFVGKLQAEVRLNYAEKVAGMASQQQVVFGRPDAPVQVIDEVVFQPSAAPLFLTTTAPSSGSTQPGTAIQTQPPTQPPGLPTGPHMVSAGLQSLMKPVINNTVSTTPLISLDSLDLGGPASEECAEATSSPRAQTTIREESGSPATEPPPSEPAAAATVNSPRTRCSTGKLAPVPTRENTVAPSDAGSTTASGQGDQLPNAVYELQVGEARMLVQKALAKVKAKDKVDDEMNKSVEDIMSFAQVRRKERSMCDIFPHPQMPVVAVTSTAPRPQAPRTHSGSSGGIFGSRFKEEDSPTKPSDAVGVDAGPPPVTITPRYVQGSQGDHPVPSEQSRVGEPSPDPLEVEPFAATSAVFVNHSGTLGDTSPAPLDNSRSSEMMDPSSEML